MDKPNEQDHDEQDIARLLKAVGPREELPPELKARWEAQFRESLQARSAQRARVRNRVVIGLCASLAVIAVALGLTVSQTPSQSSVIRVSRVMGDQHLISAQGTQLALVPGQLLPPASTVVTTEGQLALSYNGHDLRLNNDTRLDLQQDRIVMHAGEIYVSDNTAAENTKPVRIDTPHGTIRDIGTQFTVRLLPNQTVTTVRRGAVLVNAGNVEMQASADADGAARITVDSLHQVVQERVAGSGEQWQWIYQNAPAFELEGQSALDFLDWSVSETGLTLRFDSPAAKMYAENTLLHGDFGALNPEQALNPVLASTDLEARLVAPDTLLVALKRDF